jgi:GTP-binding protein Era
VLNRGDSQAVFVDTPGHTQRSQHALHRLMARVIHQSLEDCDLAVLMIEAKRTTDEDERLFALLEPRGDRTILVLNKIDELKAPVELLPRLHALEKRPVAAFVPISAKSGDNLAVLVDTIFAHLPEGPALYPLDMTTNRDLRFRAAEIVREQLFEQLRQEVPYGSAVEIEHMQKQEDGGWLVHALIWLERESHKPIVIGKEGQQLKKVGQAARLQLRELLGGRVHLELWVKVREHWADNEQELQRLGFDSL